MSPERSAAQVERGAMCGFTADEIAAAEVKWPSDLTREDNALLERYDAVKYGGREWAA